MRSVTPGCVLPLTALATRALMVGDAVDRLRAAGVARLVHSDSVPTRELPFPDVVVPLAPIAAAALREEPPRS